MTIDSRLKPHSTRWRESIKQDSPTNRPKTSEAPRPVGASGSGIHVAASATILTAEKILIIYGDSRSEQTLRRTLSRAGYVVVSVVFGPATMGVLRSTKPSLVILAVGSSEISGQDLCRRIRSEFRRIIIFVVSAAANAKDVVQLLDFGADDYITEPFVAREFLARVRARTNRAGG
jgi:PleD family two-component response regulator